jgi:hypothetical protein
MGNPRATIEDDGWRLLDAELCAQEHLGFEPPERSRREALVPGDAAKLLFDIETREDGKVIDRGVDRMWVIVTERTKAGYVGLLDSDPGHAENLDLVTGTDVEFGPEHVIDIDRPPREYIEAKYGARFPKR